MTRLVLAIGKLRGELRLAHLDAHLEMRRLMTPDHNRLYDRLGGHASAAPGVSRKIR